MPQCSTSRLLGLPVQLEGLARGPQLWPTAKLCAKRLRTRLGEFWCSLQVVGVKPHRQMHQSRLSPLSFSTWGTTSAALAAAATFRSGRRSGGTLRSAARPPSRSGTLPPRCCIRRRQSSVRAKAAAAAAATEAFGAGAPGGDGAVCKLLAGAGGRCSGSKGARVASGRWPTTRGAGRKVAAAGAWLAVALDCSSQPPPTTASNIIGSCRPSTLAGPDCGDNGSCNPGSMPPAWWRRGLAPRTATTVAFMAPPAAASSIASAMASPLAFGVASPSLGALAFHVALATASGATTRVSATDSPTGSGLASAMAAAPAPTDPCTLR